MSQLKLIAAVIFVLSFASDSAFAQAGWRHYPRYYYGYGPYGYGPPVYAVPPVVVMPPPAVMMGPRYAYPPPAYFAPPPPVAVPPAYGYGVIGPRGYIGFGYATPGFGVYIGR